MHRYYWCITLTACYTQRSRIYSTEKFTLQFHIDVKDNSLQMVYIIAVIKNFPRSIGKTCAEVSFIKVASWRKLKNTYFNMNDRITSGPLLRNILEFKQMQSQIFAQTQKQKSNTVTSMNAVQMPLLLTLKRYLPTGRKMYIKKKIILTLVYKIENIEFSKVFWSCMKLCKRETRKYIWWLPPKSRSSFSKVFLQKVALKMCSKFIGEHLYGSVISINLQSNFLEITLPHGCSPANVLYIFTTTLYENTSGGLDLEVSEINPVSHSLLIIKLQEILHLFAGLGKRM